MTTRNEMEAVVEAILFVSNDPVSRDRLLEVFEENEREDAGEALDSVLNKYLQRPESGLLVDEAAGGFRLVSRPDLHGYLRRFFEVSGSNKLSMPALEALAIVAYRQPVTGPEIAELRGVTSQGVLKTLLERRLIRVAGRKEVVGKPFLYATTREFLMHFGLRSLKELPPLEQFEELFSGDPDASLDGSPPDQEEIADQEAAEVEEAQQEQLQRDEDLEIERQREEAESAELPISADEPESKTNEEGPGSETDGPKPPISAASRKESPEREHRISEDHQNQEQDPAAKESEIPRPVSASGDEGQKHEP